MEIINKTPHDINIILELGGRISIPKSSEPARLEMTTVDCKPINGIPTIETKFGTPSGLPSEKDGVFYIVSQMIKSALPERKDLLVPANVVRDDAGRIVGCCSLGR